MDKAIRAIVEKHYEACVNRVVYRLRRTPATQWDGDDSPLRTAWDHWKFEMQQEYSTGHHFIEEMVETTVRHIVDQLSHEDGALMTLATDASDDEDGEPVFAPDAVVDELMRRVNSRACDEPHRRDVQRGLDDQARDRFKRDTE